MENISVLGAVRANIRKIFVGGGEVIDLVLITALCRGHLLIEDMPGIGKTTLARGLSSSLGCTFNRVQFTPDLTPSDLTGFSVMDMKTGKFTFRHGSLICQILLADEINRASPKTQSALLEAMQERQVTVEGTTYPLPRPFMVLATQNPSEFAGTYPLPEAQLDRFFMRVSIGYPTAAEELELLDMHESGSDEPPIPAVMDADTLLKLQYACDEIYCARSIKEYITQLASATRREPSFVSGVSPRASIALLRAAKGRAFLSGRNFVIPDDIHFVLPHVWLHRLMLRPESRLRGERAKDILKALVSNIRVPGV